MSVSKGWASEALNEAETLGTLVKCRKELCETTENKDAQLGMTPSFMRPICKARAEGQNCRSCFEDTRGNHEEGAKVNTISHLQCPLHRVNCRGK